MKLNPRLRAIANMVPPGSRVADIGTDHGYLPVFLVETGRAERVVATDISQGSLNKAIEFVRSRGLQDRVDTRLGNGLDVIKSGEVDTIVIAGMGGVLIKDILKEGSEVVEKAHKLILQPMNAQEVVRQWLMGNGLMVADECLVSDKDKIYQVIAAVHGEQSEEDSFFFELGRKLVEKRDPLLYEFAGKKIKELNDIVDSLQNAESEEGKRKLQECLERIERYREVIEACR